jgi:hypothetical protein
VDRLRRRPILIGTDLIRAGIILSVPAASWLDILTIWQLVALSVLLSVCGTVFDVADNALPAHGGAAGRHRRGEREALGRDVGRGVRRLQRGWRAGPGPDSAGGDAGRCGDVPLVRRGDPAGGGVEDTRRRPRSGRPSCGRSWTAWRSSGARGC